VCLSLHMFLYSKYKVLLALHYQYQYQYTVFTLSSHVTASTDLCSSSLKLLSCERYQLCEDESLSFLSLYYCFISQIVNAFEATEIWTIFQQMCVEHSLLCAVALSVSVFYCESFSYSVGSVSIYISMSLLPYAWEWHLSVKFAIA
jgi:hypothetical protein